MRQIKFRGKNGVAWFKGDLEYCKKTGVACIHTYSKDGLYDRAYQVNPNSIGQFIGIKDSKGGEIYEGDILEYYNNITQKSHLSGCVIYNEHAAAFNVVNPENGHYLYIKPTDDGIDKTLTIIGNIYDNPEMMEAKQ